MKTGVLMLEAATSCIDNDGGMSVERAAQEERPAASREFADSCRC